MFSDAPSLAEATRTFASAYLGELIECWLPDLRLPRTFAGRMVRSDVVADLAFTLSGLAKCGVRDVAGHDTREGVAGLFPHIVGAEVNTFWSYRVAESLLLFGDGEANSILGGCAPEQRRQLELACDSTEHLQRLGSDLPVNYAFVLARCELARTRLGLTGDDRLQRALHACRDALGGSGHGFVDDSPRRLGRYDLYLMDALLFAEPLAALLAPAWEASFHRAAALCRALASPSGELIPWGRSTGVLSVAATVEVAAAAVVHGAGDGCAWEQLGLHALESLDHWFRDGLAETYRRAGYDAYRGPARWLQLTLDVLGKMAAAAQMLTGRSRSPDDVMPQTLFPDHDELHWLTDRAAVWHHRRGTFAFTVPFVAGPNASYLAVPHQPGRFESPASADVAVMSPTVIWDGRQFVSRGLPMRITATPAGAEAVWNGFRELQPMGTRQEASALAGSRKAVFRAGRRRVDVEETLTFESPPDAVVLYATDTDERACRLTLECQSQRSQATVLDVSGVRDFRSPWGELTALRSVELAGGGREWTFRWTVASQLRVAVTSRNHWYTDSIYRHLSEHLAIAPESYAWPHLAQIDVFHVHWPERIANRSLSAHHRLLERLQRARIPIVWTVHNIEPHERRDGDEELYGIWARSASAAIHHSRWGMNRALQRYRFGTRCVHRVIAHPHFGHLLDDGVESRSIAGDRLGLPSCNLRIGVVGTPRRQRDVDRLVRGVLASGRIDVQIVVFSTTKPTSFPDDPRLVVFPHEFVTRPAFNRRLAALDAVALAYFDGDMQGTGVLADAIAAGLPVLSPDWGYAEEVLGDARVPIGSTMEEIASAIAALDASTLERARAAVQMLRDRHDPQHIAAEHLALLEEVTDQEPMGQ